LSAAGWLVDHNGVLSLRTFCNVSAARKSLGKKIREQVLSKGFCAICGATGALEIDHRVPIVRGGSCEIENLQALCIPCNRRKGRKTMEEFIA
jgi:5-methylcytosine-specific restriction endonuclease McrA